jgi:DNA repair exonuclease SbcCD ATPase subunit
MTDKEIDERIQKFFSKERRQLLIEVERLIKQSSTNSSSSAVTIEQVKSLIEKHTEQESTFISECISTATSELEQSFQNDLAAEKDKQTELQNQLEATNQMLHDTQSALEKEAKTVTSLNDKLQEQQDSLTALNTLNDEYSKQIASMAKEIVELKNTPTGIDEEAVNGLIEKATKDLQSQLESLKETAAKSGTDEATVKKLSQEIVDATVPSLVEKYLLDYNSTIQTYLMNYNTKIEQYLKEYTASSASQESVENLQAQLDKLQKQVVTNYQELSKGEQDTGKIWLDENTVYNRLVLPTTISFNDQRWTYIQHIPNFENIQTIISIKGIITSYGKVQNAVHNVDIWRVTAEGNLEARSLFGETTVSAIYLEYTKKV